MSVFHLKAQASLHYGKSRSKCRFKTRLLRKGWLEAINFKAPKGTYHFFHVLNSSVLPKGSEHLNLREPAHSTMEMRLAWELEALVPVPALSQIFGTTWGKSLISLTSASFQSSGGQSCTSGPPKSCHIFNISTVRDMKPTCEILAQSYVPHSEVHIFI